MKYLLFFTIFVVSTCGLIYELVAGTLSSYLLGDSVLQFSTIIGAYLFAMGIGAYLSKFFRKNLIAVFIQTEIITGIIGGLSSIILFFCFGFVESFRLILYALVLLTGILVGLEIPLMMRILKNKVQFKDLVSQVFTFDYIGALLASLLFPLLMIPYLGLIRTSTLFGMMNIGLAIYLSFYFKSEIKNKIWLMVQGIIGLIILLFGFVFSDQIMSFSESQIYGENIIYSTSSNYQRIVLTRNKNDLRLYLNNNLQFSSTDEYRYHEALVHPAMSRVKQAKSILVLGGGDGMAVREALKYNDIGSITLVDLDKRLTDMFQQNKVLLNLNQQALNNVKVKLINADAFEWIKSNDVKFDLIVIDFPDPSNYAVGKLYTTSFYRVLSKHMHENSLAVVQSTSPLVAPHSYWCVGNTLMASGYSIFPYHVYVPSFGEWGYFIFSKLKTLPNQLKTLPNGLKFYTEKEFLNMQYFSIDMLKKTDKVQKLDNQILVEYFEKEWGGSF